MSNAGPGKEVLSPPQQPLHLDMGPEAVIEELQSKVKKLPILQLFLDAQKARELLEPAAGKS